MNRTPATLEEALTDLCHLSDLAAGAAAETSRRDDPHRYHALLRQFDDNLASFRVVHDWIDGGKRRIALHAIGRQGGERTTIEIFAWVLAPEGAAAPGDEAVPSADGLH